MSKRERLRELAASDEGKDLNSLKMLLKICDAYIEAEAELSFLKESGDWEWHRERAREKLEELLG